MMKKSFSGNCDFLLFLFPFSKHQWIKFTLKIVLKIIVGHKNFNTINIYYLYKDRDTTLTELNFKFQSSQTFLLFIKEIFYLVLNDVHYAGS